MYHGYDDYTISEGDDSARLLSNTAASIQHVNGVMPSLYKSDGSNPPPRQVTVYTRRWYILFLFAAFNFALGEFCVCPFLWGFSSA